MNYFERAKKFRAKKRLGQNFLIDEAIISDIIDFADIKKEETVVEIGAGLGFVTEQLVNFAQKVIAIELDEDAIKILSKIPANNLEILHQDILKTVFSKLSEKKVKVIANIPYYITSPILVHLLGEIDDFCNKNRKMIDEIILMVQYEVAKRIVAKENAPSKEYGTLSILAQFFADCEILKKVSKKSFFPSPKVESALVKIKVTNKPKVETTDYKALRRVVKACFATRRKNIKNSLLNAGFSKDIIEKAFLELNISSNERGETFSIEKMKNLSEKLTEFNR